MPSSVVTSTRAFFRLSAFLTIGGPFRDDDLQPAQVRPQRRRHLDAAIGLLVVLHHRDEAAADRHARAVQGMHEAGALFLPSGAEARLHAAGLEVAAVRADLVLAGGILARQPHLHIVAVSRPEGSGKATGWDK